MIINSVLIVEVRYMSERKCICGCDSFRFKFDTEGYTVYENPCQNCNHTLTAHIAVVRSKQAD